MGDAAYADGHDFDRDIDPRLVFSNRYPATARFLKICYLNCPAVPVEGSGGFVAACSTEFAGIPCSFATVHIAAGITIRQVEAVSAVSVL